MAIGFAVVKTLRMYIIQARRVLLDQDLSVTSYKNLAFMSCAFPLAYILLLTMPKHKDQIPILLLLVLPPALLLHSSHPCMFWNSHVVASPYLLPRIFFLPIGRWLYDDCRCSRAEPVPWRVPMSASLNSKSAQAVCMEWNMHLVACITFPPLIFSIATSHVGLVIVVGHFKVNALHLH